MSLVQRRIEPVTAKVRLRIECANALQDWQGEPRRRMHRQVKRNQVSFRHLDAGQRADRQVGASDVVPTIPKPCGWRRESKRLPAQIVGGDENYLHL